MNALTDEAQRLIYALNRAGCRYAARYAAIPYSVARLADDTYLAKLERVLNKAHARLLRRWQAQPRPSIAPVVVSSDTVIAWPAEKCPYCGNNSLYIEFDEWAFDGTPTDTGTHVRCKHEDWSNPHDHSDMPYVYWMPVQVRAARWAARHVRIVDKGEIRRLAAWNAGSPIGVIS